MRTANYCDKNNPQEKTFLFKDKTKYKIGAVTYDVTAHFYEKSETLRSKIRTLLITDIQKTKASENKT